MTVEMTLPPTYIYELPRNGEHPGRNQLEYHERRAAGEDDHFEHVF